MWETTFIFLKMPITAATLPVPAISQWFRHADEMSQWAVLPQISTRLSRSCSPIRPCFLHLCICIGASQLDLTFRLRPFDTDGYQIVLSWNCHVQTSTEHIQGLIRGIHGSWWVVFFLEPHRTRVFCSCKPGGGGSLCKLDKEKLCWPMYLLWSRILYND